MFLLNSRSPLVTATSSLRSWHPFSRSYRAILPSSLASVGPIHLGLLTQGHLCRISVRTDKVASRGLSQEPGIIQRHANATPSRALARFSSLQLSTDLCRLGRLEPLLGLSRSEPLEQSLVRCWNINQLPIRHSRLRYALGPTNPRLMIIVEEPSPLRWYGFSPYYATTCTRILIRTRSTGPHGPTSIHARHLPTISPCGDPTYRWLT